jgi:hypothetical protein
MRVLCGDACATERGHCGPRGGGWSRGAGRRPRPSVCDGPRCVSSGSTTSALNTDCRPHDVDNLYVVDTFFPSSSAVNPALTAMANAMRVGDHLIERLGARMPETAEVMS